MRINKLVITKLYGYLNKTVDLNESINLLVGINGSGKTSVLNILNWILLPSLENLSVTEFENLELNFIYREKEYLITITQTDKILKYNISNNTDGIVLNPLTVRLRIPTSRLTQNDNLKENYFKQYTGLGPDKEETETWAFIYNEVPKPIVIGLDRNLFVKNKSDFYEYKERTQPIEAREIIKSSPLDEVKKVANREYSIYKNKLIDLNTVLNNKIMLSAFDEITINTLPELERFSMISIEQVDSLHKRVEKFFKENINGTKNYPDKANTRRNDSSLARIEKYFSNLKNVILQFGDSKNDSRFTFLYLSNVSQFRKLKELIKEFEDFDRKSQEYYSDIKIYLDTVNKFLRDSSKEIAFNKALSELIFNVFDKDLKIISKNRDIRTLSSGEKQILTLLTYIKFHNKAEAIFLIDEPEISLHPKWQEEFLDAVEILTSKNAQIVIATHSPVIVGEHKDYCKVLLPYNN